MLTDYAQPKRTESFRLPGKLHDRFDPSGGMAAIRDSFQGSHTCVFRRARRCAKIVGAAGRPPAVFRYCFYDSGARPGAPTTTAFSEQRNLGQSIKKIWEEAEAMDTLKTPLVFQKERLYVFG